MLFFYKDFKINKNIKEFISFDFEPIGILTAKRRGRAIYWLKVLES